MKASPRPPMKTITCRAVALLSLVLMALPQGPAAASPGALAASASPAARPPGTSPAAPRFTLVTLNLFHDREDWPRRRVQILDTLRQWQPDAIALEEVIQREGLQNQAQWLADQLGYQWYFVSTDAAGSPLRYGNALLTRRPVIAADTVRLEPLDDSRTAARLRLDIDGRALNLYVSHLHWRQTTAGSWMRRQQLGDLLRYIQSSADGAPSLIAGDFNASAQSPELAALSADYGDAYRALRPGRDGPGDSTLDPADAAPLRIDHVFFQRDRFQVVDSHRLFEQRDREGVRASDHYAMLATLQLLPAASPAPPWRDRALSPDHRAGLLVAAMTQDEKFGLIRSYFGIGDKRPALALGSAGYVPAIERLGVPAQQL
ncbi:MAG TPA: endonuclease/exonuclease/phosphatase family protein, partial [Stenotrophomonas sp.]